MIDITRNELVLLRIIPHSSVLNSQNRKLWRVLHDLLAVDDPLTRRLRRDGLRFTYQLRDAVYWVVTMQAESGDDGPVRLIKFFVLLPKPFAEVFTAKLRTQEQWRRCTVQEADPEALGMPQCPGLDLYSLKLARHDMFSLHTDYSRQTSPVRDLLQVSGEMQPGDYAGLFVKLEAVGRRRWQALSEYAWDEWHAGLVPQRLVFDTARLWRTAWAGLSGVAAEVKALVDDFLDAMEGAFFPGRTQQRRQQAVMALPDPERQALLVNGELSRETTGKRNLPVFRTTILALVGAGTQARQNMLAHSIGSAFGELAGDNRLQPVKVRLTYTQNGPFLLPDHMDRDASLLSTDEVGRIVQLPTAEVQDEFKDSMEANRAVEVAVPAAFTDPAGVFAGVAEVKGQQSPVYAPMRNMDMGGTPRVFIGSPRMGKDMAAVNWVVEAALQLGHGAVVFDVIDERNGHRGMSDGLRDHLPPERLVDLNLGDFDYPVPVTLEGITNTTNERISADRMAKELISFFLDSTDQHQTREYLRAAAKAAAGDLLGIQLVLTNKDYRAMKISGMQAAGMDTTLLEDFHAMSEGKQGQVAGPILVRLGEILEDEALRPMFCQRPRAEARLRQWMQEGKVVLYRVPARDLGASAVRTLAHWLAMVVFLNKLALGGAGAHTWFILNEPHQYLSQGFVHFCQRMLAEGPKYRLAPVFLVHNLKQLPGDFVEILMSGTLNWHVFKNTNAYVYERLAQYLAPTFTPETAMQATKRFQYIAVWLDESGEYQTPFMVRAPSLVWDRYPTRKNEWLTARHSRQYGRPYADVEAEIRGRSRAGA